MTWETASTAPHRAVLAEKNVQAAGELLAADVRFPNRDGKFPDLFDAVLADAAIQAVLTEVGAEDERRYGTEDICEWSCEAPAGVAGAVGYVEGQGSAIEVTSASAALQRMSQRPMTRILKSAVLICTTLNRSRLAGGELGMSSLRSRFPA